MSAPSHTPECRVLLIRHGATAANLLNPPILQGRMLNGPLSTAGLLQAERAAAFCRTHTVAAVYSSPLLRARQTAEPIATAAHLTVQVVPEFTEVHVGAWEQRSWDEIRDTEPAAYAAFQTDPARHGYRDGENLMEVRERVFPRLHELLAQHSGQTIVIVSHNVVNRVILAEALGIPLSLARRIPQENCGINVLGYRDETLRLISMNIVHHLER